MARTRVAATMLLLAGCEQLLGLHDLPRDAGRDTPSSDTAGPRDAPQTIELVQQATASMNSATTLVVTLPAAPVPGHVLIVTGGNANSGIVGVAGAAPMWTRAARSLVSPTIEIWFGVADGTTSTTTITSTTAGQMVGAVSEWAGLATSNTVDAANAAGATNSMSVTSGSITTTHEPDLLVFGLADIGATTLGTPSGASWSALSPVANGLVVQQQWMAIASTPGGVEATLTVATSDWDAAIVAFRGN